MARDRDDFNLQAAFEFARDTIKHLLLVNGGAIVALLTFYGSLIDRAAGEVGNSAKDHAFWGLIAFAIGVGAALSSALFAYLTQLKWGIAVPDVSENEEDARAERFHVFAMFAAFISASGFVVGVWNTALALKGS